MTATIPAMQSPARVGLVAAEKVTMAEAWGSRAARIEASEHLAAMSPERRAELEREWEGGK